MVYDPKDTDDIDNMMEDLLKDLGDYRSDLDDYENDELYDYEYDEEEDLNN